MTGWGLVLACLVCASAVSACGGGRILQRFAPGIATRAANRAGPTKVLSPPTLLAAPATAQAIASPTLEATPGRTSIASKSAPTPVPLATRAPMIAAQATATVDPADDLVQMLNALDNLDDLDSATDSIDDLAQP
jgi:hypothetical protein